MQTRLSTPLSLSCPSLPTSVQQLASNNHQLGRHCVLAGSVWLSGKCELDMQCNEIRISLKGTSKLLPNLIRVMVDVSGEWTNNGVVLSDVCRMISGCVTWVHLVAVHIRAAVTATDAGEGRYGVSVAVTITGSNQMNVLRTNYDYWYPTVVLKPQTTHIKNIPKYFCNVLNHRASIKVPLLCFFEYYLSCSV